MQKVWQYFRSIIMKNKDKTLNLEVSKLISELGVEIESEKYHIGDSDKNTFIGTGNETMKIYGSPFDGLEQEEYQFVLPAPSLQELFSVLPAIGEKLKWLNIADPILVNHMSGSTFLYAKDIEYETYDLWKIPRTEKVAHNLLDTYLSHGMEGCSREIIKLIKE